MSLDYARSLIDCGIPVFVAKPDDSRSTGYRLPSGWDKAVADPGALDCYRPGDALVMVTGCGIDVIDTDPRNGGDATRAALGNAGIMPTVYGMTRTPSGGTHEFIASLGVRKGKAGDGIDVQAGDADGEGRGLVFLPPTERISKAYDETRGFNVPYTWDHLDLDRWIEDHATDDSGDELAELVSRGVERDRAVAAGDPGPEYALMPAEQQRSVDRWISRALEGIASDLRAMSAWPVGYQDGRGRGWEKVTADACYRLGALARAAWNALGFRECEELLRRNAPTDSDWTAEDVAAKWRSQRGRGNADSLPASLMQLGTIREDPPPRPDVGAGSQVATAEVRTHGQLHIAERFEVEHTGKLIHVHGIGWMHWDGKRWTEDHHGHALRAVKRTLRKALADSIYDQDLRKDVTKCETSAGMCGVLAIAASAECFAKTVDDLDPDPYLVNCANGTLDLRAIKLHEHNPADLITKVCRAAYRPGANAQLWTEFLEKVLPDSEVREFLQRYAGLALAGACLEHLLAILIGVGRNGKTVFYSALLHALGDYAAMGEPDLFMHREGAHPTGEVDLLGRRLVIVSENDRGRKLAEATVKRLTGGDRIKARRLYRDFIEFEPSHTSVVVTNFLPSVRGDDPALWARLVVVPFEVVVPEDERDPELGERLQLEADAILAWAVAGWIAYRSGGMKPPSKVVAATGDYSRRSDALGRFLEDRCTTSSPALRVKVSELFEEWSRWCAAEGVEPGTKMQLGDTLKQRGFDQAKGHAGARFWAGIGLLPRYEPEDENTL
ncbi:phage/plasmid primase, P4 family [Rhodococcus daqingensis]|uniref:Phage/plasmid primase, P4 family n=1 Tax=Rhodococcus daqingensis TaxID=2479363 RepID=A0ABW2RV71_9NOCA